MIGRAIWCLVSTPYWLLLLAIREVGSIEMSAICKDTGTSRLPGLRSRNEPEPEAESLANTEIKQNTSVVIEVVLTILSYFDKR